MHSCIILVSILLNLSERPRDLGEWWCCTNTGGVIQAASALLEPGGEGGETARM